MTETSTTFKRAELSVKRFLKRERRIGLEKKLKRKTGHQRRSQKVRDLKKKSKLNTLLEDDHEVHTKLNIRARCDQPKIGEKQPLLLQTVLDVAMHD